MRDNMSWSGGGVRGDGEGRTAKRGETLRRFGTAPESAARLGRKAAALPEVADITGSYPEIFSMLPKTADFPGHCAFIDWLAPSKFFPYAIAHETRNRGACLAADSPEHLGDFVVEIELRSFHDDVYYTSC